MPCSVRNLAVYRGRDNLSAALSGLAQRYEAMRKAFFALQYRVQQSSITSSDKVNPPGSGSSLTRILMTALRLLACCRLRAFLPQSSTVTPATET